ncbi:MAG: protein kinase domain-containing protein [Planctomycetota bacterium]
MIGSTVGGFTIHSELGAGGMGTVYLAEKDGEQAAIKVVHPHLLETPGFFKRFMQEAQLGKRVRHANVVRTFDVDALIVDGQHCHFMVMEYVQGKSLRELLVELGTIPETLLREIALQTTAGLAAIHSEGIIHRDLKPENILITDDHEIRIMDLGVAKLQEATLAITKEGQFAGSLLYAAPEQFKRETVGPSADLYSLGVLLYELATGQHPFRSDDASAVISAHLTEQPPPARERNDELSLFVSEVIATLLAKQPADRFESSKALHGILDQSERSAWWIDRAPDLQKQEARLPRIRVHRETELHGRSDDLALLRECLALASAGQGNTVLLEGEAGIGKTRLVDSFLRGLGEEDCHVLYGSYPPSGGIGGLSEAVIGKFGEVRLADALTPYLTVTPSLVPTFAALVKHESPPTGAEPLSGDALHAVVVHLMRALAAERPTIWIVDDLQFATQEGRGFLLAMARAVEDHRVLLVAASRPGLDLPELSRLENFRRIPLARLGGREIIELLEDAFGSEDLAEKLGGKITKKSDGVPFFIFEMIRGLREGQFIKQLPDGSYVQTQVIDQIEVPSAVKDLIDHRMKGMSTEQRAILDVGAVQGMRFEPALVAEVLEQKRVRVLQEIAEIERRFGLVRGEAGSCVFDQNQIQEVLYQDLLPDLRTEYHTLLAEMHAQRCGEGPSGNDAVFLVHHHLRGSRPKDALPHLKTAFDLLEKSYRNETRLDLAKRALEAQGLLEGKQRVDMLLRQARSLDMLGRRAEERVALDEAVALADETGADRLRGEAQVALGAHFYAVSDLDAAQAAYELALGFARAAGDKEVEGSALGNLGNVFWNLGRTEEAREHHETSRTLCRETGNSKGEMTSTGNLGLVLQDLGRTEEARMHHEAARALAREIGNRYGEAMATANLGIVLRLLGRTEEAREHYEQSLAITREIGYRRGEGLVTGNLGVVSEALGRTSEAYEYHRRNRALAREVGNRGSEAISIANAGGVLLSLGRVAEAREHFAHARDICREIGYPAFEGFTLAGLGKTAEMEGDGAAASRLFEEALDVLRGVGAPAGLSSTLAQLGRLEGARGDLEAAALHLDESLRLAQAEGAPGSILSATVELARLPGGDVDAAVAAFAEHGDRAEFDDRMKACFRLWELTGDRAHLDEAHRLLAFMRDHAPEEDRDSMIENVPLHRDIMKAWAEPGSD